MIINWYMLQMSTNAAKAHIYAIISKTVSTRSVATSAVAKMASNSTLLPDLVLVSDGPSEIPNFYFEMLNLFIDNSRMYKVTSNTNL